MPSSRTMATATARMLGVKNCAKRMPPRSVNRDPPWSELNSSRNIIGKAMVKNAENGFRQNIRFWYQNWRASRDRAPGSRPRIALAAGVAAAERVRAALRHDRAAGQDHHPVGQVLGLVHVVRGQQDALAEGAQVVDQLPGVAPGRGVEPGGGLVQEDQIRVADDPERQVEPALLPTRERLDSRV